MSVGGCRYAVVGATGGIGAAVCRRLVQGGARVALLGRNQARLEGLGLELGMPAIRLDDAASVDEVESAVAGAAAALGSLDGVVNCVGSVVLKPAHATSAAEWTATLALHLNSAFGALKGGVKAMMGTGGSIVLVSSAVARLGLPNHEAVAAAKGGISALVLSAAATYAPRGIRVNAVAPGLVATAATARIVSNEASLKQSVAMHGLGRIGTPEEVASAICWLLDGEQGWVTGQIIGVDGGLGSIRTR